MTECQIAALASAAEPSTATIAADFYAKQAAYLGLWNFVLAVLAALILLSTLSSALWVVWTSWRRKKDLHEEMRRKAPEALRAMLDEERESGRLFEKLMESEGFKARLHDLISGQMALLCDTKDCDTRRTTSDLVSKISALNKKEGDNDPSEDQTARLTPPE